MTIQSIPPSVPVPATQKVQEMTSTSQLDQTSNQESNSLFDKLEKSLTKNQSEHDLTTDKEIRESVNKLNEKLLGRDMKMQFKIHQRTGYTVVKLVDMQTEKVIKEIPPENMLNVLGKIWDDMGIAIDRKG